MHWKARNEAHRKTGAIRLLERRALMGDRIPRQAAAALVRVGLFALLAAGTLISWSELQGQVSREYDVKAVFLFNFAQFVEWPSEAFPTDDTPLTIGVLGVDPFNRTLDDVLRGEKVRGRRVKPERYRRIEDVELCHILFISASESRHLPEILSAVRNRPLLTVSDMDQFVSRGGMVKLHTEEERVRLRVNYEAVKAAKLTVSSKLLRVAQIVTVNSPD